MDVSITVVEECCKDLLLKLEGTLDCVLWKTNCETEICILEV